MRFIMHVGASKTGTSALQAAFARNVDALGEAGFLYPKSGSFASALQGHVTAGNAVALAKRLNPNHHFGGQPEPVEERLAEGRSAGLNILYSSEGLTSYRSEYMTELRTLLSSYGYAPEIVLYVRAPVDHAVSAYHQYVKASRYTGTLETFIKSDYSLPYGPLIRRIKADFPPDAVVVRNYDTHRVNLVADFLTTALRLDALDTFELFSDVVNRSLSELELALLRNMNTVMTTSAASALAGRTLVNASPDVNYTLKVTPEAVRIISERYADDLAAVNAFLGDDPIAVKSDRVEVSEGRGQELTEVERAMSYMLGALIERVIKVESEQRDERRKGHVKGGAAAELSPEERRARREARQRGEASAGRAVASAEPEGPAQ